MEEVKNELARLDGLRAHHEVRMERHWQALLDHDVRGRLMKDAAQDMLRSWKPTRVLSSIFGDGSFGSSLGLAMRRSGGIKKKLLMFALSMAAPGLLKKIQGTKAGDIVDEVQVSVGRIRDYIKSRKEAYAKDTD